MRETNRVPISALRRPSPLRLTPCGFDEARRLRASGVGFVSCASSPCSPCWCCSRGWRSHSVWFAPSRARSLISTLRRSDRRSTGSIYASNGRSVLAVLRGDESRVLLKNIGDVSPIMRQAIVSVEDQRFYEHNGVDTRGIARALWEDIAVAGRRRGWLDDHPAVRQERVCPKRADDRPQGARGGARLAARAALVEGSDPARVPEHDLLRKRRLRDPAGRPDVLRQGRRAPDAGRSRRSSPDCRPTRRCTTRRSIRGLRSNAGATCCRRCTTRARSPRASCGMHRARPLPKAGRRPAAGHSGARAVLRQLRQGPADREVRCRPGLRRRAQGDEHDRPRPPGDGARGDRERAQDSGRPSRRARRDRPAYGCRTGDGRRLELPREPVQPRHAGRAAARLVVQADRARDGAATGNFASDDVRLEARRHRRRRPDLARHELRERLPRQGRPGPGDGLLGQLGVRPADEARRSQGDRPDGTRARDPQRARTRTSRSGSERSPSTHST